MAKRDRNQDQPNADVNASNGAADQSTDQATDQPNDAATSDAAVETISMDAFMSRADRSDWISVNDAATLVGVDSQKMRNASNNRAEFKTAGAKLSVSVPGYDIKPLTYLARAAVELYQRNNAEGNTRAARVLANGKRWIIRVKESDRDAVIAALAPFGITLEVASAPHKKDSADATADAPTSDASNQMIEELRQFVHSIVDQPAADSDASGDQPGADVPSTDHDWTPADVTA